MPERNQDGIMGATVEKIRRAANLTQAEVAKRTRMSAAAISRVENGYGTLEDMRGILDAINTEEARDCKTFLSHKWRHLERPPFHHPDRDHLLLAEQLLEETQQLKSDASASFEKQIVIYEDEIKGAARFLIEESHDIAFVGEIGVGKTTAICSLADLRLREEKPFIRQMILESGAGGTTICEVQIVGGPAYGMIVEPRTELNLFQDVDDFSESLVMRLGNTDKDAISTVGVSRESERAIRNMAGLSVVTQRDQNGKRHRHDPALELAKKISNATDLKFDILTRMNLASRKNPTVWYSNTLNDSPLKWLQSIYTKINNGRHPDFSVPDRIKVMLPDPVLNHEYLRLQIIDTKGIDQTSQREDIERHFDNPRTLVVLCSKFMSAPDTTVQTLLQRANDVGISDVADRTLILVLAQKDEAVEMKDHDGSLAADEREGYDMKREHVEAALVPLGLTQVPVIFFNSMSDGHVSTREEIVGFVERIRERKAERIKQLSKIVERLKYHREEEETKTVLTNAMRRVAIWLRNSANIGEVSERLHDQLISTIMSVHARSVWASTRRNGKWPNLDYYYQMGRGARTVAAKHVQRRITELNSVIQNLVADEELSRAHDLLKEILSYASHKVMVMLQSIELRGRTEYVESLGNDFEFWAKCQERWGQGIGYRDDIASLSEEWFNHDMDTQREIIAVIVSDWKKIVCRLRELISDISPATLDDSGSK